LSAIVARKEGENRLVDYSLLFRLAEEMTSSRPPDGYRLIAAGEAYFDALGSFEERLGQK
jgi:hypothetical protein